METLHEAAVVVVALCWLAMAATHLFRKRRPGVREVKRARGWRAGVLLQALSIAIVFALRRPLDSPLHPALAGLILALGAGGVWFMTAAENALGRQFAYPARLVEDHQLITTGPYAVVRHPIYLAFFAVILATALALSRWLAFPPFLALYWAGAAVRIRSEERLLREAFPREYDDYARRVPAVFPFKFAKAPLALLPLLLLVTSCSEVPKPQPPVRPVSAQAAFRGMFASARSWASDAEPLQVAEIDVDEVKASGGKAGAWEAVFVSQGQRQVRRYIFSVIHRPARNLRGGVTSDPPEKWRGSSGSEPFLVHSFRKDSTDAWSVAMEKGRKFALDNPGLPVKFLLEKTRRFADPAWRAYWGRSVSTSAYSVFACPTAP